MNRSDYYTQFARNSNFPYLSTFPCVSFAFLHGARFIVISRPFSINLERFLAFLLLRRDEVKAIFFSEFHPQAGPVVSYQVNNTVCILFPPVVLLSVLL